MTVQAWIDDGVCKHGHPLGMCPLAGYGAMVHGAQRMECCPGGRMIELEILTTRQENGTWQQYKSDWILQEKP